MNQGRIVLSVALEVLGEFTASVNSGRFSPELLTALAEEHIMSRNQCEVESDPNLGAQLDVLERILAPHGFSLKKRVRNRLEVARVRDEGRIALLLVKEALGLPASAFYEVERILAPYLAGTRPLTDITDLDYLIMTAMINAYRSLNEERALVDLPT